MNYQTTRVDRNFARKLIIKIIQNHRYNIYFSKHALNEMRKDDLTTFDVWNVLKSSHSMIFREGELEKGSYRYCLESKFIAVILEAISKMLPEIKSFIKNTSFVLYKRSHEMAFTQNE